MELVTVFNSFSPAEAQLVRSRLEAADIPANVIHETASLSTDGYSMAVGGIEVQVAEDRAEEAKALLASANDPTPPAGA
jgi:hypothetical protein